MHTIYVETSIICHLTDPPSNNPITRACQQLTQLWWHTRCDPQYAFVSEHVRNEIKSGDPLRAIQRLRTLENLVSYPVDPRMTKIEELLLFGGGLTAKAGWAAAHIACAAFHQCEILTTWNCESIANAQNLTLLRMLVDESGYLLPEVVTPFELMENSYETLWRGNPT
ncbi:hypothetical protein KW842_21980 [Duganella sp. sic0402]|uniref:hypothetical protein n=1 Tax=Duganella sp. sic0402 TaxID=2854786 RepID=UPI001C46980D|nr:hypothetical protein [Duganella sp. sic0402]MBV7538449.1 hypothetical protein [Duganella sp. sic0402]